MNKKNGLIILVLLAFSLSACTWSASTAPPPTPKQNQELASPTLEDPMNMVGIAASQTAAAQTGVPPLDVTGTVTPPTGLEQPTLAQDGLPTPTTDPSVLTTPVPQPPVQTNRPGTYTLIKGEFPYCIARRFNVDPHELLNLNGLTMQESESLPPGTTLKIPTSGNVFPPPRALKGHPATYVVVAGDTIYSVACEYGDVDPMNIAAVNGLPAPYTLTAGTSIQIP
jgi:LysM repeat protein